MSFAFDIVILSDDRFIITDNPARDRENGILEDRLVQEAFERRGYRVGRKSWADPVFDWSTTKAVIFRTTWDYFDHYDKWTAWLESTSKVTSMINPYELIKWNMDKHYLRDLQAKGINIPETYYIEAGTQCSLKSLIDEKGWEKAILKPCFSGAARHTYKIEGEVSDELEDTFQQLIAIEAMMLQPFQENVVERGEVSLMIMGGKFTHGVLKIAKPGDFRVQDDFGGTVQDYEPTAEEIDFAERTIQACNPSPSYARVDIIRDNQEQLALIELELIEPELWFRLKPEAAQVLANAISI